MRNLDSIFESGKTKGLFRELGLSQNKISLLRQILNMEWDNFDKVNGLKGRSFCQDDSFLFFINRLSQYLVFSEEILACISEDFRDNCSNGINPVEGKYARMMEFTDKEKYQNFKDKLPYISPVKKEILNDIMARLEAMYISSMENMPKIKEHSRPEANRGSSISALSYFYAEISYLSLKTLLLINKELENNKNFNIVEEIYVNNGYLYSKLS